MTSVNDLRAKFSDDSRSKQTDARNAALRGAVSAFSKPQGPNSRTNSPIIPPIRTHGAAAAAASAGYGRRHSPCKNRQQCGNIASVGIGTTFFKQPRKSKVSFEHSRSCGSSEIFSSRIAILSEAGIHPNERGCSGKDAASWYRRGCYEMAANTGRTNCKGEVVIGQP